MKNEQAVFIALTPNFFDTGRVVKGQFVQVGMANLDFHDQLRSWVLAQIQVFQRSDEGRLPKIIGSVWFERIGPVP